VADLTVWLAIVIPGVILGIPGRRLALRPGPAGQARSFVPAVLMVALTATCVGYAIASVLPYMLTVIITQAIVVFVFMFSPLTFLPDKTARLARSYPSRPAGPGHGRGPTRGTIAPNEFGLPLGAFLTLAIWCVLGFGVTYAAMSRRGLRPRSQASSALDCGDEHADREHADRAPGPQVTGSGKLPARDFEEIRLARALERGRCPVCDARQESELRGAARPGS